MCGLSRLAKNKPVTIIYLTSDDDGNYCPVEENIKKETGVCAKNSHLSYDAESRMSKFLTCNNSDKGILLTLFPCI